ncbi:hypothetical protein CBR_g26096 [Chara braunii]|uniref:Uncharacterized protein n=1 Tax=Chara braunii TaxID=69332 RepID=A0A388JVZ2_CHABU|nr:hypothetical protein CBR_g26096 [Chara braunii]|eukprot:GBG61933.1 hypothetical protein CBR_g26096 [Chara braunii]
MSSDWIERYPSGRVDVGAAILEMISWRFVCPAFKCEEVMSEAGSAYSEHQSCRVSYPRVYSGRCLLRALANMIQSESNR